VENAGNVTVDQGATLTAVNNIYVNNAKIGGAGTINGNVVLNNGTIMGAPTPGNLLVVGNMVRNEAANDTVSTFDSSVGGPGPWPDYCDQVDVDGNAQVPDYLSVSVWPGYTPPPSYVYVILITTGTLTGTFDNALPGETVLSTDGNWSFTVNYESGPYTQEVALTNFEPVPEPASMGVLGAAAIGLLARRRRG
jgi:hypothetical protein